jgi:hypothetical protein
MPHLIIISQVKVKGKGKGKVVLTIFSLTEHRAMKANLGEWRYSSTHSLTSALDGGEWSASRPGRFTHRERALDTYFGKTKWKTDGNYQCTIHKFPTKLW